MHSLNLFHVCQESLLELKCFLVAEKLLRYSRIKLSSNIDPKRNLELIVPRSAFRHCTARESLTVNPRQGTVAIERGVLHARTKLLSIMFLEMFPSNDMSSTPHVRILAGAALSVIRGPPKWRLWWRRILRYYANS